MAELAGGASSSAATAAGAAAGSAAVAAAVAAAALGSGVEELRPVGSGAAGAGGDADDGECSSDGEGAVDFDYAALEEAQRVAAGGAGKLGGGEGAEAQANGERKRKRGARNKEAEKRRKKAKRDNDVVQAKQAGLHVPSLKEALEEVAKARAAAAGAPAASATSAAASAAAVSSSSSPAAAAPPPGKAPVFRTAPGSFNLLQAPVSYDDADEAVAPARAAIATVAKAAPASAGRPAAAGSAPAPAARPLRTPAYDDGDEAGAEDVGDDDDDDDAPAASAAEAAARRAVKDVQRRARVTEARNAKTIFVTNLSFKVSEPELRDWLQSAGEIKSVQLSRDKATAKALGYAHVLFESEEAAEKAVRTCDKHELHDRVMRVALVKPGEKVQFELPDDIMDDIKGLMREAYEGKNLSCIKDAWQKRHPGKKLDTARWGFKNFSTAMKTLKGVVIETHLEKSLTNLAFFEGSSAHAEFLEKKRVKQREKEEAEKRKVAEAAPGGQAVDGEPPRKAPRLGGTVGSGSAAGAAAAEVKEGGVATAAPSRAASGIAGWCVIA